MSATLWLCVLIALGFIVFLYQHITRNFNHWKNQSAPFLPAIPIFGNIFKVVTFKQSLGHFAKEVYDYTDSRFTGFFVFDQPFLLIRDPDLIKNILIKDFEYFGNRTIAVNPRYDEIGANILFSIRQPMWKAVRTKLTPAFTTGKIKSMLHLMFEASEDLKFYINQMISETDGLIESREMCMKYTTDVISSCAFGINSQSFKYKDAKFRVAARRIFSFNLVRATQMAAYFVAPFLVKLFKMKLVDTASAAFMRSEFLQHMHQRKASNVKRGDLIDILLQMKEENKDTLDDDVLVAQAAQFFVAGFETTGSTISYALYELAANKTIQIELRTEIKKSFNIHGEVSYESIKDMKYLDSILCETFRKYPPLTFLDRRCTKTYRIPNSKVTIQEGIPIYISLLGLHMDSKYYPLPEKFNPDRFSEKNKSLILPFTYLPFGEGPRNCIGARFGLLSVKIALITMINSFEVYLDSTTPVPLNLDPKSGLIIAPEGGVINLRFRRHN